MPNILEQVPARGTLQIRLADGVNLDEVLSPNRNTIPNLPRNQREMAAKFLECVNPNHHVIRFYYLVFLTEK